MIPMIPALIDLLDACPHTRGDDPAMNHIILTDGELVPIRVGMILYLRSLHWIMQSCPHTRGDDPI